MRQSLLIVNTVYSKNCSSNTLFLVFDANSIPISLKIFLSLSDNIPSSFFEAGKIPSFTPTIYNALTSLPFILATSPIFT